MPNKYIRVGATFNGDGTTNALAASDGGVGAWNSITIFEGTSPSALPGAAGTLAAGDVVYIRGKDEAGVALAPGLGADKTLGAGAGVATAAAPITWIIDNGTEWAGITDGSITYTTATAANECTIRNYNNIIALDQDAMVFQNTATAPASGSAICRVGLGCVVEKPLFDWSAKTGNNVCILQATSAVLVSPHIKWGRVGGSAASTEGVIAGGTGQAKVTLVNPDIELLDTTISGSALFAKAGGAGIEVLCIGGRIRGAGVVGQPFVNGGAPSASLVHAFRFIGTDIPSTMVMNGASPTPAGNGVFFVEVTASEPNNLGGHLEREWGWATSRLDNNPPTLSAFLPDGKSPATAWAWRVYPRKASALYPVNITSMKMYLDTAGVRTITQELIIADTLTGATKENFWITVDYTNDADGLPKHINSRNWAGGALASSTADWTGSQIDNTVDWGLVTLTKHKMEVTTPTAIKTQTPIIVTVWSTLPAVSTADIWFLDPSVGVAA